MQFIKGMDVSMLKELEEHGATYSIRGVKKDIFEILKESGVNLIRLRIWDNPYSETGEAYGGGTNDLNTTIELAKRLTRHGLEFMLDFHYSDFWTDPAKQIKPKAWKNLTGDELKAVVYDYTADTLKNLEREGVLPSYVQVGNEVTKGLLWPDGHIDNVEEMAQLLEQGINAVKQVNKDIKVILHLDFGTDNQMYREWFDKIQPYNLNYDMIGMSYYPYWNGSLNALLFNMNDISKTYGKDVLVAETAIGYTVDTLGCNGLVYSEQLEKEAGYPASEEGQAMFLQDLYATVRNVEGNRGAGVLYWEPAWLPIPECTWANPIGCEYMNDKAEVGNSWANQALFDASGDANQALLNLEAM